MTVEDIIQRVQEHGMRVNNLFQREDGTWQANLRRREPNREAPRGTDSYAHEFGLGATPAEALSAALGKAYEL